MELNKKYIVNTFQYIDEGIIKGGWKGSEILNIFGQDEDTTIWLMGHKDMDFDETQLNAYKNFIENKTLFEEKTKLAIIKYYNDKIYKYKEYIMFDFEEAAETIENHKKSMWDFVDIDYKAKKLFEELNSKYNNYFPKIDSVEEIYKLKNLINVKEILFQFEFKKDIREVNLIFDTPKYSEIELIVQFENEEVFEVGYMIDVIDFESGLFPKEYYKNKRKLAINDIAENINFWNQGGYNLNVPFPQLVPPKDFYIKRIRFN